MATLYPGLLLCLRQQEAVRVASVKAPPPADYCTALTARWRRATLAVDKVVRTTYLARSSGALAAGQWAIMTVYVPPHRIRGDFQLKEKVLDYRNCWWVSGGTYITLWTVALG